MRKSFPQILLLILIVILLIIGILLVITLSITGIILGAATILVCLIGFYGAWTRRVVPLRIFMIVVFILFVLVAVSLVLIIFKNSSIQTIDPILTTNNNETFSYVMHGLALLFFGLSFILACTERTYPQD